MKKQKFYVFLRKQILLMIGFSFIPGLAYIVLGWMKDAVIPALILSSLVIGVSLWGWKLYRDFEFEEMVKKKIKFKEVPVIIKYTDYSMEKGHGSLFGAFKFLFKMVVKKLVR